MERRSYRLFWWILGLAILAGIIWYVVIQNTKKEYTNGTLVLVPYAIYQEENCNG